MSDTSPSIIPAKSARFSASLFNYGNIISMLLPVPLGIFWFGMSMMVYAMNRHHPNKRVGHYTQQAAYRFYGVLGFIILPGTAFTTGLTPWLITWAISALILVPLSVRDLIRIRKEEWQDTVIQEQQL
jgi:hypothetical protein